MNLSMPRFHFSWISLGYTGRLEPIFLKVKIKNPSENGSIKFIAVYRCHHLNCTVRS